MRRTQSWAAGALLLVGTLVYLPGLSGGFAFDDYHNIVDNPLLHPPQLTFDSLITAALSSAAGPLRRPIASLSFLANYQLAGAAPLSFKVTNLLIHLVNGSLLLVLLNNLLPRLMPANSGKQVAKHLAILVALAWTLHPVNLTAVLYVVQRMTSLSAMFVLTACLAYTKLRLKTSVGRSTNQKGYWTVIAIGGFLGLLCKETAALTPLLLVVIEFSAFDFIEAPRLRKLTQLGLAFAILGVMYLALVPDFLINAFRERPFNALERGLTELRILFFYLSQIVLPTPNRFALFHADWNLSRGLFVPWTTAFAGGLWLLSLALAFVYRRRMRLAFFALTWYLTGHLIESTVVPLDLIYEHRNYLPSIGMLCLVLLPVARFFETQAVAARLLAGGILLSLGAQTAYRSWQWSDPITLAVTEARHNPESTDARYEYGRIRYQLYIKEKRPQDLRLARVEFEASAARGNEAFRPLSALIFSYLAIGEMLPDATLSRFVHDLQIGQPNQRRLNSVYTLIDCQLSQICRVAPDIVLTVVSAVFDNPKLQPDAKAMVLEWLAVYYANSLGDLPAARTVALEAMELAPSDWHYRLRVLEVMIAQRDWVTAKRVASGLPPPPGLWCRYTEPKLADRFAEAQRQLRDRR